MNAEFTHRQAAHCESGVTSNLMQNVGVGLSEAMAFGIGSGIFFVYLPMVKVMQLPLTSYRSFPGTIFKKTCRRLNIGYEYRTYGDAIRGARALDDLLQQGQAVGLRSNIYWLNYIPEKFRFQFNAHNLVVYGKNENEYLVSDPVLEEASLCAPRSLNKARFSKGPLAPRGLLFYPQPPPAEVQRPWAAAIRAGIGETTQRMLFTPFPFFGVAGIRYLSRHMCAWPKRLASLEQSKLYVANVVRMQEEIGTGGAGFRFLYAAFLQESGRRLQDDSLLQASRAMTDVGNLWREFAVLAAKYCKDRLDLPFCAMPDLLLQIAAAEKQVYKDLRRNYLRHARH